MTRVTLIDFSKPLAARAKSRKSCGPYYFERPDSFPHCGPARSFYMAQHGVAMDERGSSIRLRIEPANDHLRDSRLARTTGYYCDTDSQETIEPIIARLPRSRGFLAGWTMGEGMVGGLDTDIYDSPESAAQAAHSLAEMTADRQREFEERERAELDEAERGREAEREQEDDDDEPDSLVNAARQLLTEIDSMGLDRLHPLMIHSEPLRLALDEESR